MAAAGRRVSRHPHGRLVVSADEPLPSVWAANVWRNVEQIRITSIGHAAKELRDRQRTGAVRAAPRWTSEADRREAAVGVGKPVPIGGAVPDAPLGSWTLLEPDLMLAAGDCSSPFPNGEAQLVEDREGPPSRAYLKLYESFARMRRWPRAGETCLDLGASPGGWTWLLAQTGASVVAIDNAPLADHVARVPDVRWQQGSASPSTLASACGLAMQRHHLLPTAPARARARWLDAGAARDVICTIKFQGVTDQGVVRKLQAIPGGRVLHLHHNRHELTYRVCVVRKREARGAGSAQSANHREREVDDLVALYAGGWIAEPDVLERKVSEEAAPGAHHDRHQVDRELQLPELDHGPASMRAVDVTARPRRAAEPERRGLEPR